MSLLRQAIRDITPEKVLDLEYGEELELNEGYSLYKYTEEDIVVLVDKKKWEERYTVLLYGDKVLFEEN